MAIVPLLGLFMGASHVQAVQSYEPNVADPLLESWRWSHIEELDGMGFQCMAQEPNGVMWFGLKEGVMRYDGLHWRRFNLDDGLTPLAKSILTTQDGHIYVQTSQAIHLYQDHQWITLLVQAFPGFPGQGMATDARGGIWAACAEGLIYIQNGSAEIVEHIPGGVTTVFVDSRQQLWFLPTDYRMAYFAPLPDGKPGSLGERRSVALYHRDRKRQGNIIETKDGRLWIASDAPGDLVHVLDPRSRSWSQIDLGTTVSRYICTAMAQTGDGTLWLIGQGELHAVHAGAERTYRPPDLKIPSSRSALLVGTDGSLWIGGRTAQVYRIDYSDQQYTTYQDLHFQCESPPGVRWFLHKTGAVVRHDTEEDAWLLFGCDDGLPDAPVVLTAGKDGSVWAAGSHQGDAAVARYDGQQWHPQVFPNLAFGISAYSVLESASGDMLFGSASHQDWDPSRRGGLLRFFRTDQAYQSEHLTYP